MCVFVWVGGWVGGVMYCVCACVGAGADVIKCDLPDKLEEFRCICVRARVLARSRACLHVSEPRVPPNYQ